MAFLLSAPNKSPREFFTSRKELLDFEWKGDCFEQQFQHQRRNDNQQQHHNHVIQQFWRKFFVDHELLFHIEFFGSAAQDGRP